MLKHPFYKSNTKEKEIEIRINNSYSQLIKDDEDTIRENPSSDDESQQKNSKEEQTKLFISFKTLKEVIMAAFTIYLSILLAFFISLSLYPGISNTQYLL